jgi:hypothetical protein
MTSRFEQCRQREPGLANTAHHTSAALAGGRVPGLFASRDLSGRKSKWWNTGDSNRCTTREWSEDVALQAIRVCTIGGATQNQCRTVSKISTASTHRRNTNRPPGDIQSTRRISVHRINRLSTRRRGVATEDTGGNLWTNHVSRWCAPIHNHPNAVDQPM